MYLIFYLQVFLKVYFSILFLILLYIISFQCEKCNYLDLIVGGSPIRLQPAKPTRTPQRAHVNLQEDVYGGFGLK